MVNIFRYLTISLLALSVGCSAPQNKSASVEVLRDSRHFNNVNVYGGCETDLGRVFGQFEMKSSTSHSDLTNFNSRIRIVKPIYNCFGVASEYRDFSGERNDVAGIGVSYCPVRGIELRIYPVRTDQTQEVGISFGRVFEAGKLDPYLRGFVDVDRKNGEVSSVGKFQIGLKTEEGWRVGMELRYSDFDRKNGVENPGVAFGVGLDF